MEELYFEIGTDQNSKAVSANLQNLGNIKIIGCTGSGKSCFIDRMVYGIITKQSVEDYELYLVDPKQCELKIFESFASGYYKCYLDDVNLLIKYLEVLKRNRQLKFDAYKVNSIQEFNNLPDVQNGKMEKMKHVYMFIDEYADLYFVPNAIERLSEVINGCTKYDIQVIIATQRIELKNDIPNKYFDTKVIFKQYRCQDCFGLLKQSELRNFTQTGQMYIFSPALGKEKLFLYSPYISQKEILEHLAKLK